MAKYVKNKKVVSPPGATLKIFEFNFTEKGQRAYLWRTEKCSMICRRELFKKIKFPRRIDA